MLKDSIKMKLKNGYIVVMLSKLTAILNGSIATFFISLFTTKKSIRGTARESDPLCYIFISSLRTLLFICSTCILLVLFDGVFNLNGTGMRAYMQLFVVSLICSIFPMKYIACVFVHTYNLLFG